MISGFQVLVIHATKQIVVQQKLFDNKADAIAFAAEREKAGYVVVVDDSAQDCRRTDR